MYSNRRRPAMEPKPVSNHGEVDVVRLNRVHCLDEEELEKLYMWVDEIPLSRPKRNISRDFSDGVLAAELVKFFLPRLVELHNYTPTSSNRLKADNWYHFNRKVLVRLDTEISHDVIHAICACKPHVVESVLCILRDKIDYFLANLRHKPQPSRRDTQNTYDMRPEADQDGRVDILNVHSEPLDFFDSESRGYIPSAEGFYQEGQFLQPQTRSPQGKAQAQGNMSGRIPGKQEMLPKGFLDEREKAIESREQSIKMLADKIQRLEHLLKLKDMRIDDLQQKLDQLTQPHYGAPSNRGANNRLQGGNRQPVGKY